MCICTKNFAKKYFLHSLIRWFLTASLTMKKAVGSEWSGISKLPSPESRIGQVISLISHCFGETALRTIELSTQLHYSEAKMETEFVSSSLLKIRNVTKYLFINVKFYANIWWHSINVLLYCLLHYEIKSVICQMFKINYRRFHQVHF